jgi:ABC-type protease/lipase transport system fused ATPase/permease subunit
MTCIYLCMYVYMYVYVAVYVNSAREIRNKWQNELGRPLGELPLHVERIPQPSPEDLARMAAEEEEVLAAARRKKVAASSYRI